MLLCGAASRDEQRGRQARCKHAGEARRRCKESLARIVREHVAAEALAFGIEERLGLTSRHARHVDDGAAALLAMSTTASKRHLEEGLIAGCTEGERALLEDGQFAHVVVTRRRDRTLEVD